MSNNFSRLKIQISILTIILVFVFIFPYFYEKSPYTQNLSETLSTPSKTHPLGTDIYGRDLLARLARATGNTLKVAALAAFMSVFLGTTFGLLSGFTSKMFDEIIMRIVDMLLGFPKLVIILLLSSIFWGKVYIVFLFISFFSWVDTARVIRSEVKIIKEKLFYKAVLSLGLNRIKILMNYIFPLIRGKILVSFTLNLATFILVEVSLSFLGLGFQSPEASLGTLLRQTLIDPVNTFWITIFTGITILLINISLSQISDNLEEEIGGFIQR
ncbi:MAG: ABC transporter permease [Candidatus Marinimicrobia bacterium]|nr:ABC transporter permease [Candidatus Neomarinimicrobiota bacterium]